MDSSIHLLLASTHAQERIREATGARHAAGVRRESLATSPTKPNRRWHRPSSPVTASISPQR